MGFNLIAYFYFEILKYFIKYRYDLFKLNICKYSLCYLFNRMKESFYHIKIYLMQHLNFLLFLQIQILP